ncbi:L-Ala-D/L-Glu epimerase [Roseimaritima multifibrata]|uniref:Dipeptide epimerase n=1 Tax=Roseimaritima multifibrata TaxID=1930274 RepID=A0A517MGT9_9BACT|nr:dipeptide epimerase [Roseimaritima multifibrata]QDS94095.1 L-Ala-D/L-Glu epimerase [Roseimaritima multifibrata]
MIIRLHRLSLPLQHEFRIARGAITAQNSLVVELELDGFTGFGETTENSYYGRTFESMTESIEKCRSLLSGYQFGPPEELWDQLFEVIPDDMFALSAIDLAVHDLCGKQAHRHTFDMLGLQWQDIPESSYTIGIDSIETMRAKLAEQPDWSIYKIKLGTSHDVDIVKQLREVTNSRFRVDANCGWSVEETIENSKALRELGVEFIEQPLPATATDADLRQIYEESVLPIVADESCQVEADVAACHNRFHGVNVKLCKCGGITPAVRMLQQAKQLEMKTMVGCMIESSIGISGAAQLLPLLDYADLDGAVLLSEDPAVGVQVTNGVVTLSDQFGNGGRFRDSAL